jgi:uncharacterized membrane protein YhaH (DUF805 family)
MYQILLDGWNGQNDRLMRLTSNFVFFSFLLMFFPSVGIIINRARDTSTSTAPYATAPAGHGYITWAAEHHMSSWAVSKKAWTIGVTRLPYNLVSNGCDQSVHARSSRSAGLVSLVIVQLNGYMYYTNTTLTKPAARDDLFMVLIC